MTLVQDKFKTLEVKVRPFSNPSSQERADQKGASRVHLSKDALLDLRLESGEMCYICKVGEEGELWRKAIAWATNEKSLSKKVVQISKAFQEACSFKLGDELRIGAAVDTLEDAYSIVLEDVTSLEVTDTPELSTEDRGHWEWFLGENLGRADLVFPGMILKSVQLRGPKRTFKVLAVNEYFTGLAQYRESCAVTIASQAGLAVQNHIVKPISKLELTGIAGIDQAVQKLNRFLSNFERLFKYTWAQRSCAVLLHGSHGTGKTLLSNKVAETGWGKVYKVEKGAKAASISKVFEEARRTQPSIILIDDMDSIVSNEESSLQSNNLALGEQLDRLIDDQASTSLPLVVVVATTSDLSKIPLSLRKRGRFKLDIALPIPDTPARKAILKSLTPPISPDCYADTLNRLGDRTHAYTAEDLVSLLDTACEIAEERSKDVKLPPNEQNEQHYLVQDDIEQALLLVRPTAMHDITLKPPSVRWDEIGGQGSVKKALRRAVETPLLHPERMKRLGATAKKGLLLYGPPGCSKTLSAQAMATEAGFNFFAVKGAELLNMYVGESERAVREIFARARGASPSIIFFDEIESIGSKRETGQRGNGVNVLTTLLNEMDGIETLKGVTVLAATNQPHSLDLALLRPGRFDKLLYVAPPDLLGREEILNVRKRRMDCADDVNLHELALLTEGYSGAELVGICQAACDSVLERCEETGKEEQIMMQDLVNAVGTVKKQITPEMVREYERWAEGIREGSD